MPLTRIEAENFTVFEDITIQFSKGLNVLFPFGFDSFGNPAEQ